MCLLIPPCKNSLNIGRGTVPSNNAAVCEVHSGQGLKKQVFILCLDFIVACATTQASKKESAWHLRGKLVSCYSECMKEKRLWNRYWAWESQQHETEPVLTAIRWLLLGILLWNLLYRAGIIY